MYAKHHAPCDPVTWLTVAVLGSNTPDIRTGLQSPTLTTAEPVPACVPTGASRGGHSQSAGEQSHRLAEHLRQSQQAVTHIHGCALRSKIKQ